MAKQIIALSQSSNGTTVSYTVAFWFPISAGQQPNSGNSTWTGASTAENTAIQNGNVKEEVQTFSFPIGIDPLTIKAVLQKAWADRNAQINGIGPNQYYGIFFDSVSGWSA